MTLFHCVNTYPTNNQRERERLARAQKTWFQLYGSSAGMIKPAHCGSSDLARDARSIGDSRDTPFIRDIVEFAFKQFSVPGPGDSVMLTNADSCLVQETGNMVMPQLMRVGCCFSTRRDMFKIHRTWLTHQEIMDRGEKFIGVDMVAFTRGWWEQANYPDLLIGYEGWDWVFKFMMGNEIPAVVYHEVHDPYWARHRTLAVGQLYNRRLCYEWAKSQPNYPAILREWKSLAEYGKDGVQSANSPRAATASPRDAGTPNALRSGVV